MAENITIARPYAKAVFLWAHEDSLLDVASRQLQVLASVVKEVKVAELISNPKLSSHEKIDFLLGFLELDDKTKLQWKNFITLIVQNRRVKYLPEIASYFETLKKQHEEKADITLVSARTLSDGHIAKFQEVLSKKLKKGISINPEVDPTLLAGVLVRVGDHVIDGSARGKLFRLANSLRK